MSIDRGNIELIATVFSIYHKYLKERNVERYQVKKCIH